MQQVYPRRIAFDVDRFMLDFLGRKKLFRAQAARSPGAPEDANGFSRHLFPHLNLGAASIACSGHGTMGEFSEPARRRIRNFLPFPARTKQEKMPEIQVFLSNIRESVELATSAYRHPSAAAGYLGETGSGGLNRQEINHAGFHVA
jgi:hypothetical protein